MVSLKVKVWTAYALCLIAQGPMALAAEGKPGTPGPEYFAGTYERVGRAADKSMLDDLMSITPAGQNLAITACTGDTLNLSFGPAFEVVNIMTGSQGGDAVQCLFHNNGYNYPILTCRSEAGAAFTLWPTTTQEMACNG